MTEPAEEVFTFADRSVLIWNEMDQEWTALACRNGKPGQAGKLCGFLQRYQYKSDCEEWDVWDEDHPTRSTNGP